MAPVRKTRSSRINKASPSKSPDNTATENPLPSYSFLALPPEIRNAIYEYAVCLETHVALYREKVLFANSLSLLCRQVRREYRGIYDKEIFKYASHVLAHTVDFRLLDLSTALDITHQRFPIERRVSVTLVLRVTNMFDSNLHGLRRFNGWRNKQLEALQESPRELVEAGFKVILTQPGFDVTFFAERMNRMNWCLRRSRATADNRWPQLYAAIIQAIDENMPASKTKTTTKRKRKAAPSHDKPDKPDKQARITV